MEKHEAEKLVIKIGVVRDWFDHEVGGEYCVPDESVLDLLDKLGKI